jgi:glutamyl endopeptidase
MANMLRSILHEPSQAAPATESSTLIPHERVVQAITTRKPVPMKDISKDSRRRLVAGKSGARGRLVARTVLPSTESVLGIADERTRIDSTTTAPWKYICALEIDAPSGRFVGTAWVVAPRTLITAGHCVFDPTQMGGWARKVTVWPGRDGELRPFGPVTAARFSALDAWVERQEHDFDVAALHLDADLFGPGEGFQVGALPDADLLDSLINVSGYPANPGGGQEQWWARNRIREVTTRRIFYDVDTSGGQSGGPAYIFPDGTLAPIVVGIHAYGIGGTPTSIPFEVNSAPRIVPELIEQIQAWIDADLGEARQVDMQPDGISLHSKSQVGLQPGDDDAGATG